MGYPAIMMKEKLEQHQIWFYVLALTLGIGIGFAYPAGMSFSRSINFSTYE